MAGGAVLALTAVIGTCFGTSGHIRAVADVVDGDTWVSDTGEKIREIGIDTPETWTAFGEVGWSCEAERAHGEIANARARELLEGQRVHLETEGSLDRYGRLLGNTILPDGRDYGDVMIAEGLAAPWEGRQHEWCRKDGSLNPP